MPSNNEDVANETLTKIIKTFHDHLSIIKIKSKCLIQETLSFQPVFGKHVEKIIKNVPNNKNSGHDTPIKILKQPVFTNQISTDCINDAIIKVIFPDGLKIANITPVHKRDEPKDKENYRPVSVLTLLTKVVERLITINLENTCKDI